MHKVHQISPKSVEVPSRTVVSLPLSRDASLAFCFIPAGSFMMGSPADAGWRFSMRRVLGLRRRNEEGRNDNEDQVEVTLSQPFWLAKTQVTQAQWEAVMGSNPSDSKGANLPVEYVSWDDAQAFIAKLNGMQISPTGWEFALPTEAQWEYACRAGEKGPYSGGSLDKVGWYLWNSNIGDLTCMHEVGQKKANAWGLHDMHGNVDEWCADCYEDTLKGGVDPKGPSNGASRVVRGGSFVSNAADCRAARRKGYAPGSRVGDLGFRPALVPSR